MVDRQRKVILVGYGEIGRNQHAPILISRESFELCAIVDPALVDNECEKPTPVYSTLKDALNGVKATVDAVVIACPPQFAQEYAWESLNDAHGLSVFMEKPPGFDCQRLEELESLALSKHLTLYTGYHSTACPHVNNAKVWFQGNMKLLNTIHIEWKESMNKWHPGQSWIADGAFGVLDILFNPMSMLEEIFSGSGVMMKEYKLIKSESKLVAPRNWNGPISGTATLAVPKSANNKSDGTYAGSCSDCMISIVADYAWDHEEEDIWKITFVLADGRRMELHDGGARMMMIMDDGTISQDSTVVNDNILRPEYDRLYDRFADLLDAKECEVRIAPLRIMMDILQNSEKSTGEDYSIQITSSTATNNSHK